MELINLIISVLLFVFITALIGILNHYLYLILPTFILAVIDIVIIIVIIKFIIGRNK